MVFAIIFVNIKILMRVKQMKIAYVTDSGTGKSITELAKDGIISIPLQITDGKTTYQDMENFSKNDCIKALEEKKVLMTSQPAYGLIEECFTSLKEQGFDLIVAVPICNGLSGTGSTMTSIAKNLGMRIICIDSYTTCVVQEYLVKRIKKAYEDGLDDMQIMMIVDEIVSSCETIVIPRDLESLARGGRLTPLAAKLLKLLRIVPILHLGRSTGGRIDVYDKTMTLRKAIQVVLNHMKEDGVDSSYHVAIAHTNDVPNAENIYHRIVDTFPGIDAEVISLCNVVSAQAGLGCLALEYFKKI